ncbi:MAG: hypothetical protein CMJ49_00520 [Planctomycetaceae bacterium]|nr:hypothetical protein [Planctomycetaceae bacterium]
MPTSPIQPTDTGITLHVKVIPNASRDQIVGPIGDAIKIKVTAPPEAGKANAAVRNLLARALDPPPRNITVQSGSSQPQKRIAVDNITPQQAAALLNLQ